MMQASFLHGKPGRGVRGAGRGKDMVGFANQFFIVRFAHGRWLSMRWYGLYTH